MKKFFTIALILGIFLLNISTVIATGNNGDWPESITVMAGPAGGIWNTVGAAIASLWNNEFTEFRSVELEPGGGVSNVIAAATGQTEFGFGMANSNYDALSGAEPYDDIYETAGIAAFYPHYWQMVVLKDSGIKEVEDLRGKSIAPAAVGNVAEIMNRQILEVHGLSYDDLSEVQFISFTDAVSMMKDGHLDCFSPATTLGAPTIVDVSTTRNIDLVGIRDEKIKELLELYDGYSHLTIPANTYKGVDYEVETVGAFVLLHCNPDLPEDMVYELTKSLWENRDKLVDVHVTMKNFNEENAAKTMIPLHPGAEKFYREIGIL